MFPQFAKLLLEKYLPLHKQQKGSMYNVDFSCIEYFINRLFCFQGQCALEWWGWKCPGIVCLAIRSTQHQEWSQTVYVSTATTTGLRGHLQNGTAILVDRRFASNLFWRLDLRDLFFFRVSSLISSNKYTDHRNYFPLTCNWERPLRANLYSE